jgi:hypothetical protein
MRTEEGRGFGGAAGGGDITLEAAQQSGEAGPSADGYDSQGGFAGLS